MKTERKSFDLGLYSYKPIYHGTLAHKDEAKIRGGQVVAVLHPMRKADPSGIYCFGLTATPTDGTLQVMRKNLRFHRIVTLSFERQAGATYEQETHQALNTALLYLQSQNPVQGALIEENQMTIA